MGFGYYSPVTPDATKCGTADSTDFPMLFSGGARFATVANGGRGQSGSGYDTRPFTSTALTSALTYQLVPGTYNAVTGAGEWWVKQPTLSHTSGIPFYMACGDATISTDGSSTATWDSNFKGVWHFPDGSTLSTNDSTATGTNATSNSGTATTGKVDGGVAYNGSQFTTLGNESTYRFANTTFTVSFWAKWTTTAQAYVVSKDIQNLSGVGAGWGVGTTDQVTSQTKPGNSLTACGRNSASSFNDGSWHHVVVVFTTDTTTTASNSISIYVDGASNQGTLVQNSAYGTSSLPVEFGRRTNADSYFTGSLDEARISSTGRAASWNTSDAWQYPSSGFYSLGTEVSTLITGTSSRGIPRAGSAAVAALATALSSKATPRATAFDWGMPAGGVLRLIPAVDGVSGVASSGQAFTVTGTPSVSGAYYAMATTDGLVLDKSTLPVNSAGGFTIMLTAQITGSGTLRNILGLSDAAGTAYPTWVWQATTGKLYAGIFEGTAEESFKITVSPGVHAVALRYDPSQAHGSRVDLFIDGVKQVSGKTTTGTFASGVFTVPSTTKLYVGNDTAHVANASIGSIYTKDTALSDTAILAAWDSVQVLASGTSSKARPRGATTAATALVQSVSNRAAQRAGTSATAVLVAAVSARPETRGGASAVGVVVTAGSVHTAPRSGGATTAVGIAAATTRSARHGGVATVAVIGAASSSRSLSRAGSSVAAVLVLATSSFRMPRVGVLVVASAAPRDPWVPLTRTATLRSAATTTAVFRVPSTLRVRIRPDAN